jgi:hypothetical protein
MSPKAVGGGGGVAGTQPRSTAVYRSPNNLWRSSSILQLTYGWEPRVKLQLNPTLQAEVLPWNCLKQLEPDSISSSTRGHTDKKIK